MLRITLLFPLLSVGLLHASSYVGVALSGGPIQLNHAKTAGNATIMEGNLLETAGGLCRVRLSAGGWAQLGSSSGARFFNDRVELDHGSVRISGYEASASGLKIRSSATSVGTVAIHDGLVEVSSINGVVFVYDAHGAKIASVQPGRSLNLSPAGSNSSRDYNVTGCVVNEKGKSYITDNTSNVEIELQGAHLTAGREIQVTGREMSGAPGSQRVVKISTYKQLAAICHTPEMASRVIPATTAPASVILPPPITAPKIIPSAPANPAPTSVPQIATLAQGAGSAPVSMPAAITAGVKIYPTYGSLEASSFKDRPSGDGDDDGDDRCLSADRDCKHHHHGHGYGHDDGHGNGHDNGHGNGNGHGDH